MYTACFLQTTGRLIKYTIIFFSLKKKECPLYLTTKKFDFINLQNALVFIGITLDKRLTSSNHIKQ